MYLISCFKKNAVPTLYMHNLTLMIKLQHNPNIPTEALLFVQIQSAANHTEQ